MSKESEIQSFIKQKALVALNEIIAELSDRQQAESVRNIRLAIAARVGWEVVSRYSFLELADIMEWRRTRVRR